jgi:hypothetical protein
MTSSSWSFSEHMKSEKAMYRIDHLMVETAQPKLLADEVMARLGLPLAWPLVDSASYSSVGVSFGDVNVEFINFTSRFGIQGSKYEGFSGIAFR